MGATLCFLQRTTNTNNKANSGNGSPHRRRCSLRESMFKVLIRPGCLSWAAMKRKKRQILQQQQETKEHDQKNAEQHIKVVTLEDWISASPDTSRSGKCSNGPSDLQVLKQHASKRVFPSFDGESEGIATSNMNISVQSKATTANIAKEESLEKSDSSSICRSRREKLKKKVSFRLPEVADVFILDSSGENCPALGDPL